MAKPEGRQKLVESVLIVTYNIHSMGGVPRSTSNIANGLVEREYRVGIASISPGAIPMKHAIDERIDVITCNPEIPNAQLVLSSRWGRVARRVALSAFSLWKPRRLRFVKPQMAGVLRLRDRLQELDPDDSMLLVTDVNSMDYVEAALALMPGPRPAIVAQYKGSVGALSRSRRTRIVDTYRDVDLILCLTPDDAHELGAFTNVPTDWITNPIPEAPLGTADSPKKQQFVTMGRLSPEKGLFDALKAWKIIADDLPGWELVLYGEGPLRDEIESAIKRYGLSSSVHLGGRTDFPVETLGSASAMILPSRHEGFGLVIAEAATAGTPTIAFDCSPGVRMQVDSGKNGVLAPVGDVSLMAKAMEKFANEPDYLRQLSENAKESVRRFNVENTMERWDSLIFNTMAHRNNAR